jgi:integrase
MFLIKKAAWAFVTSTLIPRRRHDLRHTAASFLLARGVELAQVSQLLGHSKLHTTTDLYGHLMHDTVIEAAQVMDSVLPRRETR